MKLCRKEDLLLGDAKKTAEITRSVLTGEQGPRRDAVLLNSAAAIYIARPWIGMKGALAVAIEAIDSGAAIRQLERFIELSQGGNENDPG